MRMWPGSGMKNRRDDRKTVMQKELVSVIMKPFPGL